jgi:N-acetylglucosamine kinase-like BadF-type ATPase
MARLFLGVDGGKSSTTALIGDESGRILGWGTAGPSNHAGAEEGRAKLVRAITESVSAACVKASLEFREITFHSACLGFSGGAEDKQAIVAEVLAVEHLKVTTDVMIALAGATGGEPGIVTNAGTGSIAFGRNAAGKTARAGGWGYVMGDDGGGFDLARQGLRAALRYEEGWGPATRLLPMFLEAAGAKSANELLHRFYTAEFPRPRIAAFAPLIERAVTEGDPVATGILRKAAAALALLASAVRRQLFAPGERARVAYLGGVFRGTLLRDQFRELVEQERGNVCGPLLYPPAAGALIEAYRAAGLNPRLSGVPEIKR